jgi:hypothetical protein
MDGFKDSTKMKYMTEGGTYNERGRRATMGEIAAEDRRMAGRPSEGVSSRPTDASGRRASNADLGMTSSAKKSVGPSSVAVSKVLAGMTKPVKKALGGGVDAKLSRGITKVKADNTAPPRAKPTMVDMLPKNSPLRPSSGNPLMGGPDKPQVSGGPVTDPRANIGNTLEIMKKQGSARELPTPSTMVKKPKPSSGNLLTGGNRKPKGTELLTPPISGRDKHLVPRDPPMPTRGPSVSGPVPGDDSFYHPDYRVGGKYGPKTAAAPTRGPSMSPAFNDRPMVRRKTGGLAVMPKGKC